MIQSRHNTMLKEKIERRKGEMLQAMASGVKRKTYWLLVGRIEGLDEAAKLGDDADYEMSGGS